jgi:putative endonuclease
MTFLHDIECGLPCTKCGKPCYYLSIACNDGKHWCGCQEVWYVYILECFDHTLYTGITNNLERRIKQHNENKGAKYTRGRGPVILIKSFQRFTKSDALKLEYKIKKLSKEDKLKFQDA